jgi:hypothetical protein
LNIISLRAFVVLIGGHTQGANVMRALAAVLMLGFVPGLSNAGEANLYDECRVLFAQSKYDCGCVTRFIEPRFGDADGELLFTVLAHSERGSRDGKHDRDALHNRYGSAALTRVLYHFHLVRFELYQKCPGIRPEWDTGF